jgi:outer membrane protein assembly factor BamB
MKFCVVFFVAISLASTSTHSAAAAEAELGAADFHASPQHPIGWRGDGNGRFIGASPVTEWSTTKNVRWSLEVGKSYSSPVATDKVVLLTSEPNWLICIDRASGKVKWKVQVTPADVSDAKARKAAESYQLPKDGSGMAAATPLTDGTNIYVVFANGIVCAVDMEGKPKWTIAIEAEQNTGYGRSASPIMVAGKLIVSMTNLYAFDPATGKQLWINEDAKSSYGTPAGLKVGQSEVIVTPMGAVVTAADGKTVGSDIGHTAHSTPIAAGSGLVFFADNTASMVHLSDAFKDDEVWSGMVSGEVFGSPVLHEKTIYMTTGAGELFAFDAGAKDSAEPLIDRRALIEGVSGAAPAAYASLTLAGKYLFYNSNKGEIVVMEANREAKIVARNKMARGTGASMAFWGKEIFLRDGEKVYCIGG